MDGVLGRGGGSIFCDMMLTWWFGTCIHMGCSGEVEQ